jgi:mRNA-degrading endonuclease YafQ of YafQ-DinJ toxin-antitoxin module
VPQASDYSKTFLKDWENLSRSGRYDMNVLKEVMLLLVANDGPLDAGKTMNLKAAGMAIVSVTWAATSF